MLSTTGDSDGTGMMDPTGMGSALGIEGVGGKW